MSPLLLLAVPAALAAPLSPSPRRLSPEPAPLAALPASERLPAGQAGVTWEDARGHNVLVWSAQGDLWLTHLRITGDQIYEVQALHQPRPECLDGDQTFELVDGFALSDADRDGVGELTFAIREACITDMSAQQLDVQLWEDGERRHLWGETIWWDAADTGTVTVPVLDGALLDQPALRGALEDRFRGLIAAERAALSPDAVLRILDLSAE